MTSKLRVIKDYEKLDKDIKEQIKLVYPEGFSEHLIKFKNATGDMVSALPFETSDKIYMIRMSVDKAIQLIEDDDDYEDDGTLKGSIREEYEEKHSGVDYLAENENYSSEEEEEDNYGDKAEEDDMED